MHDPINPSHYTTGGIECIDAMEASMSKEAFKGFLKGNCQKYLWRYELKNGSEDLKKAQWYLERLINTCESKEQSVHDTQQATKEVMEHIIASDYDPDDYMISGCPDGFCPLPNVRTGPSEPMFPPVN